MKIDDWGEVPYQIALDRQMQLVEEVIADPEKEVIIFCRHPSVVTLGRKSKETDLLGWSGEVYQVQRGGSITYHGPGQSVIYPILHLGYRNKDLHLLLRSLELALVHTMKELYAIEAQGKKDDATGVWVGERKVASIGIAVRKWVSYHGMAVNLYQDPLAFNGIRPCGFSKDIMTSLEAILGKQIEREQLEKTLKDHLSTLLARKS